MMILMAMAGCIPTASGCNAGEALCAGSLAVDLEGERPVFALEGMEDAALLPNALSIVVCPGSVSAWDMWSIDPESFPLPWGEVPEGAEHVEDPDAFRLEEGTRYVVSLGVREKDVDGLFSFVQDVTNYGTGESGVAGWSGSFVWGDPDSYEPDTGCGGGDSGL
jgi:hypothetical protein